MRRIIKDEEPEFWKNYKRKNKNVQYDDLGKLKGEFNFIILAMDNHPTGYCITKHSFSIDGVFFYLSTFFLVPKPTNFTSKVVY